MDSPDSSAPPPYANLHRHLHHHHHFQQQHHHPQPSLPSHHAVLMGTHTPSQIHPSTIPYPLPNSNNNNSASVAATNTAPVLHQQNPPFPFNSAPPAPKPMDNPYSDGSPSASGGGWFNIEPARKKRGRPRKYSPDNSIGLGLSPAPASQISPSAAAGQLNSGGGNSAETPAKRNRGRPPGSVKKQMDALGVPGVGFTPHVITVEAGEDIASKIMTFSQQGPRTVCILSANGAVSNVTLLQPAMSGGTVTYEGRFEIISLSGSLLTSESDGNGGRSGGLSVSLAGTDGRVLGGGVAGMLKAASTVQVVVGSFIAEGRKSKSGPSSSANNNTTTTTTTTISTPSSDVLKLAACPTESNPPSLGASAESADENDGSNSPPLHHHGSGPGHQVQSIPMYSNMGWSKSMKMYPN